MKKLFVFLILVSVSVMGFTFQNQDDPPGRMRMQLMEKLNLNPDQLEKFKNFHYEHEKEMIDLQSEIEKNDLEIRKMMSESPDKDALIKLSNKNNELRGAIQNSRINLWFNIYEFLNADQRVIWTQHFAQMGHGRRFGDGSFGPMHKRMMDRGDRRDMRDERGNGERMRIHRDQ